MNYFIAAAGGLFAGLFAVLLPLVLLDVGPPWSVVVFAAGWLACSLVIYTALREQEREMAMEILQTESEFMSKQQKERLEKLL